MVLFLLIVPSVIIGPEFNWECLQTWCQHMVKPFVIKDSDRVPRKLTSRYSGS